MRDRDVRAAMRAQLSAQHHSDPSTRIVEEMGIWAGTVRIDMAVINGELSGYELKSDRDTLARLPAQESLYSRVFDRVTLVAGQRHLQKAISMIPEWWGLICAIECDDGIQLDPVYEGEVNPSPDAYLVAELLRKEEALAILEEFNLVRGWRNKRVKAIHQRLASELPFDLLSHRVRSCLKQRNDWLGQNRVHQLNMSVHAQLDPVL